MVAEVTRNKLKEMKLTAMSSAYIEQENVIDIESFSFDERFAMLVDAEWDSRRTNKRIRLLRSAKFSEPEANLMDVKYFPDRKLDKAQITEFSNCKWIKDGRNIILTGASGAGKSWLACALGVAACNSFYSTLYVRLPELLDSLTTVKDEEWIKRKKRYQNCSLLIIDDWLLDDLTPQEARELLEIIEARYHNGSLILCSQFGPGVWHSKLGEGAVADAVIDRLVYSSYMIHIEGEVSMRKRLSTF